MNLVGQVVTVVAIALTGFEWLVSAVACWTSRRSPRVGNAPEFARGLVTVVIPSRGGGDRLERNLQAHLNSNYPQMRVIVAVECETDPGVVIVRKLAEMDERLRLVVAGEATVGCQQNHNMIAGVREAEETTILAFADNDFEPERDWLSELVGPLEDSSITVTSGYRWVQAAPEAGLGGQTMMAINMTMYAHFTLVNLLSKRGLWGGSFAIRKSDYDGLKVENLWRTTVSDDMTLAKELSARGLRTQLVRGLLVVADDVDVSPREAIVWFGRQLFNLRCYDHATWAWGMGVGYGLAAILLGWPVVAGGLALFSNEGWSAWGGAAGVLFWMSEMVTAGILLQCGPRRMAGSQIWGAPWARIAQIMAWVQSAGARSLRWAEREYDVDAEGRVIAIRRIL